MKPASSAKTERPGLALVLRPEALQWSDAALVQAVRAGDARAKAALFDRYGGFVRGIVVRLLGLDQDVVDVVHDVFVSALSDLGRLEDPSALKSWLTSVAVFTARRHIRYRSRRRWLTFMQPWDVPERVAAPHAHEAQQGLGAAYRILRELDVDERVAFTLRYLEGMELKEVADACRVSLATIKRRIKRAEETFRARAEHEPCLRELLQGNERGGPL